LVSKIDEPRFRSSVTVCVAALPPDSHTLFAQAEDSYGAFGDPLALTLTVQ
jgi:hypothetical protein